MIKFEIKQTIEKSRLGSLKIGEKEIKTPVFIPKSTGLNVSAMFADSLANIGFDIIYADICRPLLRLGLDNVYKQGGLCSLMGFEGLLFLGSGAEQIAEMSPSYKVKEDGITYSAYTDGSSHKISPESSVRISRKFKGNFISGLFDEPHNAAGSRKKIGSAVRRTTRWTRRAFEVYKSEFYDSNKSGDSCFFAPVTGGAEGDLRMQSAVEAAKFNPDGFLFLPSFKGEPAKAWFSALQAGIARLPASKPAALMGVDSVQDLYKAVVLGFDMIISDFPVKDGMNGFVYTSDGILDVKDEKYFADKAPVIAGCNCPACLDFSLSYLHHLFVAEELLGPRLAVWHNLAYVSRFMSNIRAKFTNSLEG